MKLTNNTILITGGTSGIGLELGKALKSLNNQVILLSRNTSMLNDLEKKGFHTIRCDLKKSEDVEAVVLKIQNTYPELNMLFNNAGIQYNYLFTDIVIPVDKINQELEINFTGQALLTQLLIPILATKKNAMIVNTTSALGSFPKSDGLIYSASKAAMRNFTIGLRYSLNHTGIKVVEFIPPVTQTAMTKHRTTQMISPKQLIYKILPQIEKEKKIVTVPGIRLFLLLAIFFPRLANKIVGN